MGNGSYRIQLYQNSRYSQDPFENGVLTVHKISHLGDERDQASWYVHARPTQDPHTDGKTWKIVSSDDGTFKIQLSDTGELLALHNHYDGDQRDENSAYVHVRKDDCHTHNTNWIISMVNRRETNRTFKPLENGIYQIKLAEVKGEHSFGYDNGILAMQAPYHDRDIRDESSRFVHLRHPLDRVQYPGVCWKFVPMGNGSYRIQLFQNSRNAQDPFENGVLTVHKISHLGDERDQASWYVHARPTQDPHTDGKTWKIVSSDDGTFKIQLSDTGELLALHNHYDGDQRDENSAYVHVRKDDCHTHNTNWIISMVNGPELLADQICEIM